MPHSNLEFKWLQPERTEPSTPRRSPALPDAEIGRLWHKHFPKRYDDLNSRQICYGILAIVEYEAALRNGPTDIDTVNDALKAAGINRKDFDEVKADSLKRLDCFA